MFDTLISLSLALALYQFDLTLWLINLTIVGLLPLVFNLWEVSVSCDMKQQHRGVRNFKHYIFGESVCTFWNSVDL